MPTINYDNVGEVLKHEFLRGVIQTVDSATDTCTVTVAGRSVTALLFYHCTPESAIRDNGAIEGAAGGFKEDDEVLVQTNRDDPTEYLVVAHLDGVRLCGWKEMWDEPPITIPPTLPLLCKNHRWSMYAGSGLINEWCPILPAERTTIYGTSRIEINDGICSLKSTGVANLHYCVTMIVLDCTGSDAPVLNDMIMKIKSTTTPASETRGGCHIYMEDSAGYGQTIAMGGLTGKGIINGVDNDVGVGDGTEKIIDLSIYRPVDPSTGLAKGPLRTLYFASTSYYLGAVNSWDIDYIKIL